MMSKEMRKAPCPPGYWFENVAPLGETPDWQIRVMPPDVSVEDHDAEADRLFGYTRDEFLAKQYRKTA